MAKKKKSKDTYSEEWPSELVLNTPEADGKMRLPNRSFRFWDDKVVRETSPAACVYAALDTASEHIVLRRLEAARNAVLTDCDPTIFGLPKSNTQVPNLTSRNIIRSAGDAIVAAVAEQKYVPVAVTENGNYKRRAQARQFNQAIAGAFQKYGVHRLRYDLLWDALRWGAGVTQTINDGLDVLHNRVFLFDFHVDPYEARYGWSGVRTLYHRYLVDRENLFWTLRNMGVSRDVLEPIWSYVPTDEDTLIYENLADDKTSDVIPLTMAYHLSSGPGADDGRFFLGIRGKTFVLDKYDYDSFPYAFQYQHHPAVGVFPTPFVTRYWPDQKLYDELTMSMIRSIKRGGQNHVLQEGEGTVSVVAVGEDKEMSVVKVTAGTKLETLQFDPINPQVEQIRQAIPGTVMTAEGIPEQWVTGQVPAWLQQSSGRAQQVAVQEGSKRLEPTFECSEEYTVDVGRLLLRNFDELSQDNPSFSVPAYDGLGMKRLKYKDIGMAETDYDLMVDPANRRFRSLPAKFGQADEWRQNQLIDDKVWEDMQELPDTMRRSSVALASRRLIERNVDWIIENIQPLEALGGDDLDYIKSYGNQMANLVRLEGKAEGDENTDRIYLAIQEYVDSAIQLQDELEAAQAAKQAAASAAIDPTGGQPMGAGSPLPMPEESPMGPPGGAPPMGDIGMEPGQMSGQAPTS